MATPSRLYVPLRGNAHSLLAGAPGNAVRRRLKLSALLFGELLLDGGHWIGLSGPRGAFEMRGPEPDPPGFEAGHWQPAHERHHGGRPWHLATEVDGQWLPVISSPTTVFWRASYSPIRHELPHAYDWIQFDNVDLLADDKRMANTTTTRADLGGPLDGARSLSLETYRRSHIGSVTSNFVK